MCHGHTLSRWFGKPEFNLAERTGSPLWQWLREIAMGIQQLHSHNPPIYHRDLKTLNLLVGPPARSSLSS